VNEMFGNGKDPYTGLDIEQILNLDDRDFKHWNVHSLVMLQKDMCSLKKRPARTRATMALGLSAFSLIILTLTLIYTVTNGGA
jgi:hypothetical protein